MCSVGPSWAPGTWASCRVCLPLAGFMTSIPTTIWSMSSSESASILPQRFRNSRHVAGKNCSPPIRYDLIFTAWPLSAIRRLWAAYLPPAASTSTGCGHHDGRCRARLPVRCFQLFKCLELGHRLLHSQSRDAPHGPAAGVLYSSACAFCGQRAGSEPWCAYGACSRAYAGTGARSEGVLVQGQT